MATIVQRKDRKKPWLAQIKRKGHGVFSQAFLTEQEAIVWAAKEEEAIANRGQATPSQQYKNTPVRCLVLKYFRRVSKGRPSYETDKIHFRTFLKSPLAQSPSQSFIKDCRAFAA
jgi:hypothetical protein